MNIVQVSYVLVGWLFFADNTHLPIIPIIIHLPKIGRLVCFTCRCIVLETNSVRASSCVGVAK